MPDKRPTPQPPEVEVSTRVTSETSTFKLLGTDGWLFPQLFFQLKLCERVRWISHKGMVRSKPVNVAMVDSPFKSTRT